jgi:pyridoxine 5-phosphate synthase
MKLSINIDHIATLRNSRGGNVPDPIEAARICERAGADGIVCHLREDRRHIRDEDVKKLREVITTKLDLEMAATPEIISFAKKIKPELVTLVPEKRKELTTEGGLNVIKHRKMLRRVIADFYSKNILVSLFVDPVEAQIEASKEVGADFIEIHTGEYAREVDEARCKRLLEKIYRIAEFARKLHLRVNAGHGLDYKNVGPIAAIKQIEELSIGHAVITHAVFVGLENAVREMRHLVRGK